MISKKIKKLKENISAILFGKEPFAAAAFDNFVFNTSHFIYLTRLTSLVLSVFPHFAPYAYLNKSLNHTQFRLTQPTINLLQFPSFSTEKNIA